MNLAMRTDEADDLMFIEDPRVPEGVRVQAARLQPPVAYAAWGGQGWVLFAQDGSAVDLGGFISCSPRAPRRAAPPGNAARSPQ